MQNALCNRPVFAFILGIRGNRFVTTPTEGRSGHTALILSVVTKTMRVMQLTAILLTVCSLAVAATSSSQSVTFSGKNVGLEKIFSVIEQQTGFVVVYEEGLLKAAAPVSIDAKDMPVEAFVLKVLDHQPLSYSITNRTIAIQRKNAVAPKFSDISPEIDVPPIKISGTIVGNEGQPLAGATVRVRGKNISAITDDNGYFELTADAGSILLISYVGFKQREFRVNSTEPVRIDLIQIRGDLDTAEILINTGYQKISRERFVGSYQQLDSQAFHSRPGMGIIERLDGRVNSVFFNKKGSAALLPTVLIRGVSTLGPSGVLSAPTSFSPLIVIDNFPMPESFRLENVNANDVESVTVLTDAASASIWGARAGNGVIVITTKQGKYNQRIQVDVSSNVTITERPNLFFYDQITTSEFIDLEQYAFDKGAYDGTLGNSFSMPMVTPVIEILDRQRRGLLTTDQAKTQLDALRNHDLRQQLNDHVYRNAVQQQHYLSVRGGTNSLSYQMSAGYNRSLNSVKGVKPDEGYTLNTNTTFKPHRNLEILSGIQLTFGKNQSASLPILPNYPYALIADEDGNSLPIPNQVRLGYVDTVGNGTLLDWHYRPLDEIRNAENVTLTRFIRLNAAINYRLTSWLKAGVQFAFQNAFGYNRTFYNLKSYFARDLINRFTNFSHPTSSPNLRYPVPVGGILDLTSNLVKNYNLRSSLTVNKNFGVDHQIDGLVAWELTDSKGGYLSTSRTYGYDPATGSSRMNMDYLDPYPAFYAPTPFSSFFIPNINRAEEGDINRFVSILANVGYAYKSKYSVYASARRDGANLFGVSTNNQWKPLWSVGGSWEISKETFYKVNVLPLLKLRISYGYTGNSNNSLSGVFSYSNSLSLDPITGLPFAFPNYAPNNSLKWEEVGITNLGIDFGILKGQWLSGSLEIFRKKAEDVISLSPNPASTGVLSYVSNYANLDTEGYEIKLNSKNITGVFNWTSNFGWSYVKTKVTKLFIEGGRRIGDYLSYSLNPFPGQIIFGLSSYRWAGLDPSTGDPLGYYEGKISKNYNDIANDSVQHQVFHGSSLPLSTAFLRNNFSWKGLNIAFNFIGRFQYYFREPSITASATDGFLQGMISVDYYRRWQKPGDEAITNVPSIYYPISGAASGRSTFYQMSEIHVKRGDNIRLQDVNLSWQWNTKSTSIVPFQSITVFAYLNNINWIVWRSASSEWDPDFIGGSSGMPQPSPSKTWTLGATINF